jgi:hypothetical protein
MQLLHFSCAATDRFSLGSDAPKHSSIYLSRSAHATVHVLPRAFDAVLSSARQTCCAFVFWCGDLGMGSIPEVILVAPACRLLDTFPRGRPADRQRSSTPVARTTYVEVATVCTLGSTPPMQKSQFHALS